MENLQLKFNEIKIEYEDKIKKYTAELEDNGFHTILNLKSVYKKYINELDNLFYEYEYCVPYEMYESFFKISIRKFNYLYYLSEYCRKSGNLPGAFLKEATGDLSLWSVTTLLEMERTNNYSEIQTKGFLSLKACDTILSTEKYFMHKIGYAIDFLCLVDDYVSFAYNILSYLGMKATNKAYKYYKTALKILKDNEANANFDSLLYNTYNIKLNSVLNSYKIAIEEYGVKCDFDIDKKIFECNYQNYRQAQTYTRDKMIIQVKKLINNKKYSEAKKITKEIIDICEERAKYIKIKGVKLSLKNAYELFLSIPNLTEKESEELNKKLKGLISKMGHDEFFVMDGDKEYPRRPM